MTLLDERGVGGQSDVGLPKMIKQVKRGQNRDPTRGELNSQRQALQHRTDFTECAGVVLGHRIAAGHQGGSVQEQSGRITVKRIRREHPPTHRRDGEHLLDRYLQRNPAGRKYGHRRTGGKQQSQQLPTHGGNLFTVVHYQQRLPISQGSHHRSQCLITNSAVTPIPVAIAAGT
jgi:hypothetical protein